jgi:DNA-binding NarL/FixJ family response regulator
MMLPNGILLVNSNEDECRILGESLYQAGIRERIRFSLGAREAMSFLVAHSCLPLLVIVDLNMPDMEGMISLRQITQHFSISVLTYSAVCNEDLVQEVKATGAIGCVKKGTSFADNQRFARHVADAIRYQKQPATQTSVSTCL